MEWLIAHHWDVFAIPGFNCSEILINSEKWTRIHGTPRPILGYIDLIYGVLIEILYFPCMLVMLQKDNIRLSCFKIMFLLGLIDMCAIGINSIENGILLIEGAVFCSHPTAIFVTGSLGLGFWCSACLICMILVINRVLDILFPTMVRKYFSGSRTCLVLLIPIFYGLFYIFFTPPLLFTSKFQAWFFDPFIYESYRGMQYQNYPHTANNLFIVISTCLLYGYFCLALSKQFKLRLESTNRRSHTQIFLQSTLICLVNFIAAMVYVYMQFLPVADIVIVIGHISWQLGHGCPAIIYLFLNSTIRKGVSKYIQVRHSKTSQRGISTIGGSTRWNSSSIH